MTCILQPYLITPPAGQARESGCVCQLALVGIVSTKLLLPQILARRAFGSSDWVVDNREPRGWY